MLGRQSGKLMEVRPVDIHGALFFDISYSLDTHPDRMATSRIGRESVYTNPQAGDEVTLHLVLSQLTKVEKR